MSHVIHARTVNGRTLFRVWSTITDSYLTEPLSEEDVKEWERQDAIAWAVYTHELKIGQRIEDAKRRGTSSPLEPDKPLTARWERQRG